MVIDAWELMLQHGSKNDTMPKTRLEAFSDGVIAFAITLLILDIHIPDLSLTSRNSARTARANNSMMAVASPAA